MREHLYKGFHPNKNGTTEITLNGEKIKGEWVEGSLLEHKPIFTDKVERTIVYHNGSGFCYDKVIPETVCEYTGLLDKNGNKIFEGDIVRDWDGRVYVIKLFDFEWIAEQTSAFWINIKHLKPCEIIGNIYDNPELRK